MEMSVDTNETGVTQVQLDGSLDIAGAEAIDMKMSVLAGNSSKVVIDMANVSFMASIGVRTLVKAAKAINQKGGKMVVARPNDTVAKVLSTTGVDQMIPVHGDIGAAIADVSAA